MKTNRIPSLAAIALLAAALVAAGGTADVQARILEAEQEARGAVRARAREFRHFIVGNNNGAHPFAEEIIGWYGTCRTAWGYVGGDGYEAYLNEVFAQQCFLNTTC